MRVPVSWLKAHIENSADLTPDQIADALVKVGHEVEDIRQVAEVTGPLVVGRVVEIEELKGFKKPIRYCLVEVVESDDEELPHDGATEAELPQRTRGVICGATNFAEGDLVVVALPGAVLPGGFKIAQRETYGHTSDGMICSARELGLGDDHTGIMVLGSGEAEVGEDAIDLLELRDTCIELAITPDKGYALSIRGLARDLGASLGEQHGFIDPTPPDGPAPEREAYPVEILDEQACPRFTALRVTGVDADAPTPLWMRHRLMVAGIRSISLPVDVTNYVMLELGQPMHAYDTTALRGKITVRKANAGEKLSTLDDVQRELDPDDIVVCDESGPIGLGGVMGGATTEVRKESTDILLEAAVWDPASIARTVRRHKLPSEAAKRFERSVDPLLGPAALDRAGGLLRQFGDGTIQPGKTVVGDPVLPAPVRIPVNLPDRIAGRRYPPGVTYERLLSIGCSGEVMSDEGQMPYMYALPPAWRPDLQQAADLVEEVLRLEGYDTIPSELPPAPSGRGLTPKQRRRRTISRALAEAGYVEVLTFPFVAKATWDAFGLAEDDVRRNTLKLVNPLEADKNEMATTLLPGLLEALVRNVARGARDVSLYNIGQVVLPKAQPIPVPDVPVTERPSDDQVNALLGSLPNQPVHAAAVLAGNRQHAGWWGSGEPASWADAVQAARVVAQAAGVELRVVATDLAPWHPGRCAQLRVGDWPVGHAGELHPKVIEALGLPKRTCAMEIDLDQLPLTESRPVPKVSPYPPVLLDVAVVVDKTVPVAEVAEALRMGGGELLEELSLFDVYTGEQLGEDKQSLAYSLRFRAPDRTLTVEEATAARDAAVAKAGERVGATIRS